MKSKAVWTELPQGSDADYHRVICDECGYTQVKFGHRNLTLHMRGHRRHHPMPVSFTVVPMRQEMKNQPPTRSR